MMTTKTDMTVANEIANQIGGRAFFMLGAGPRMGDANSLSFSFKGCRDNRANKIKITLTPMDVYCVEFFKIWKKRNAGIECTLMEVCENIYAEDLHACIERVTGLYLSL